MQKLFSGNTSPLIVHLTTKGWKAKNAVAIVGVEVMQYCTKGYSSVNLVFGLNFEIVLWMNRLHRACGRAQTVKITVHIFGMLSKL